MKKFLLLFTLFTAFITAIFTVTGCVTQPSGAPPEGDANSVCVTFVKDNKTILTVETDYGNAVDKPDGLPDAMFIIWLYNGAEYDFEKPVTNDITLTASLTKSYTISFVADGVTLKSMRYYYDTEEIEKPEIPEKIGYKATWEDFSLTGGDITVNAIYTPVIYFVSFFNGGTLAHECTCTYEEIKSNAPEAEPKRGYTSEWVYTFSGETCIAELVYTPVVYTVNFIVDGKIIAVFTLTVLDENHGVEFPAVPEKEHYSAEWMLDKTEGAKVEFVPRYTPLKYSVGFYDGDKKVYETQYDIENAFVVPPEVPQREHYVCSWDNYVLDGGDKTVNLIATPVVYTVEFVAGGKTVARVNYTVEDNNVTPPAVPELFGHYGEWESFALNGGNMTVNAVYVQIEGTAGLLYEKKPDGFTVTGYVGNETVVIIPNTYRQEKIVAISDNAFNGAENENACKIEEVRIYADLQSIGQNAFLYCEKLKNINFPDSLKQIGECAFQNCVSLESAIMPDGLSVLGISAFSGCTELKTLKLSKSLTEIPVHAFSSCLQLVEVAVPDGVTSICSYAFANCLSLKKITFGENLEKIDVGVFFKCESISYAQFKDPADWWYLLNGEFMDNVSQDFSNPESAAKYLVWRASTLTGVYYEKRADNSARKPAAPFAA